MARVAGDISQSDPVALLAKIDEIEPVTGNGSGGVPGCFKGEAGDQWHGLQEKSLLDGPGLDGFAQHAFAFRAFKLKEAGVFDGYRDMSCESLKDLELIL
jgi:hypothetical protein